MQQASPTITNAIEAFGLVPEDWDCVCLGNNGGYSGASLWRLSPIRQKAVQPAWCLRRWPMSVTAKKNCSQCQLIQATLRTAIRRGFPPSLLPVARPSREGQATWVTGKAVFEMTRWLPGEANYCQVPTERKLRSMMTTIAQFHQTHRTDSELGNPPGIAKRIDFINDLNNGLLAKIESAADIDNRFGTLALELTGNYRRLSPRILLQLLKVRDNHFPIQLCIRDLRHEHVFFEGENVSAIVDFGAVGPDHVAADLSRLMGDLVSSSPTNWTEALDYYNDCFALSTAERELIAVYDQSTTMLAGLNWMKWILLENRNFGEIQPIINRLERCRLRMLDW